jgi:dTDP-4-amino-4,6-dideoxygalactose transaminase
MVDLYRQYEHVEAEIDDAIKRVIQSSAFIKGPEVKDFESELADYLNVKHVITCANGTDALQISLMCLGLQPGDEVITPDFTFIATVEVIALLGLKPVLADVNPDDYTMNLSALKKAISPKTKAIIPVHLFGQCANMTEIQHIAEQNNISIIEDTAQALGADYVFADGKTTKAGTIGDLGTTSFFPSKNLGCFGDGGAVYTNNDKYAELVRSIANHGMKKQYYYQTIGVNSRLDAIQAAILRIKLRYLDHYNQKRRIAADFYDFAFESIDEISTPFRNSHSRHIFHQYTLKIANQKRNELQNYLKEKGIPGMIYYPSPLHAQPAYKQYAFDDTQYPVTNQLCHQVISIPMHTELTEEELEFITQTIINFFI